MENLFQDFRFSLRTLVKNPGFTLVAVATLALGIGGSTAIFSVVNAVLLEPLPIDDAGRVVRIERESPAGAVVSVSIPTFRDWRDQSRAFAQLGAYRTANVNLTHEGDAARLLAPQVTQGFFRSLGREPIIGRVFTEAADQPGAPLEAVVAEGFWRDRLGSDPDVEGRSLRLDGRAFRVVGVMPRDFIFPSPEVDLWLPLGAFAEILPWEERGTSPGLYAVGRLRDGVTLEQMQEDLDAVTASIAEATGEKQLAPRPRTLREIVIGEVETPLLVLLGAVGFLLLIACANVANLMLARSESRRLEIATRLAIGAGRSHLLRQLLLESLLVAIAGGILGILGLWAGLRSLTSWLPSSIPLRDRIEIDGTILGFTLLVVLLTSLFFGLAPALRSTKLDLNSALRQGARRIAARHRLRSGLVVAEVAFALILLIGAGLMGGTLRELLRIDPGFRAENVITMRIALPPASYSEPARWEDFYNRLLERVATLPGVEHAGINNGLPLASGASEGAVIAEGLPFADENLSPVLYQVVSRDYFAAMGIPRHDGRVFDAHDTSEGKLVTVVGETLAEQFWPGDSPLGRRLAFEFDVTQRPPVPIWREVIGVVGHVRHYELESPSRIELYVPYQQMPIWLEGRRPSMALVARTSLEPTDVGAEMRAVVRDLDPNQPVYAVQTMTEVVENVISQERLLADLFLAFSLVALLLAAIGIYGVISWGVTERTREIGLRMALGARIRGVLGMVVLQGLKLAALGLAIGLAASLALSRTLESLLYGVSATDPGIYALVALSLSAVAVLACLLPAYRAARVDPVVALRHE